MLVGERIGNWYRHSKRTRNFARQRPIEYSRVKRISVKQIFGISSEPVRFNLRTIVMEIVNSLNLEKDSVKLPPEFQKSCQNNLVIPF